MEIAEKVDEVLLLRRALRGKAARLAAVRDDPDSGWAMRERTRDVVILCEAVAGRLVRAVEAGELPENVLADAAAALRL